MTRVSVLIILLLLSVGLCFGQNDEFNRKEDLKGLNISAATGIWTANGELSVAGTHGTLGFQVGTYGKFFSINFRVYEHRFGSSENNIPVVFNGLNELRPYVSGLYTGLDLCIPVMRKGAFDIELLGSAGWEGFSTSASSSRDLEFSTGSFAGGLGMKYFFSELIYSGLESRMSFLNYSTKDEQTINGNALSFKLSIGFVLPLASIDLIPK